MLHSRDATLAAASPRVTPRAMPLASIAIHASAFALFVGALILAATAGGFAAWAPGLVYIVCDTALVTLVITLTLGMKAVSTRNVSTASPPSLGVMIAAHNEASVLPDTLAALLAQSDPPDVILIVDDGSTDATANMLHERFGLEAGKKNDRLRLMQIARGGKVAALNAGLAAIDFDIVVAIDADTILEPDAIAAVRAAFAQDTMLVAAGGIIAPVCEPTPLGRIMQMFQTTEYIRSMVGRFAWARAGCLVLISGAFSAFRRDALLRVGGFDAESIVEDYEITHRLHRYSLERGLRWRLDMIPQARAITHAPAKFDSFLMQRRRWFAGYLQVQFWNRDIAGQRQFGSLGMLMMPLKVFDTLQPIHGLASFLLLIAFALAARWTLVLTILAILAMKYLIDLGSALWMAALVRQVSGGAPAHAGTIMIAALIEPLSFQPLRQLGAAWGWLSFLTSRYRWGRR